MNAWVQEHGWNKRAEAYANRVDVLLKSPERQREWSRRLQSMLGGIAGLEVLDVGTGSGFLALQLSLLGYRVTGLDFSEEMLRIAAETARDMQLNSVFVHGRAEKLPFCDGVFDAVVSRHLLPYLNDCQPVFEEWLRVLKPGGRLAIWDGDWPARNVVPYALMQGSSEKKKSVRHGVIKRQGAIYKGPASSPLLDRVAADLKAAGFCDIQFREKREEALAGSGIAQLCCEQFVLAARKL